MHLVSIFKLEHLIVEIVMDVVEFLELMLESIENREIYVWVRQGWHYFNSLLIEEDKSSY